MHALVVDDDPDFLRLAGKMAEKVGLQPSLASSAAEAWEVLTRQHVPLLFVDWMMAEVDGLDLTRRVRARPERAYTYVLLVTSRSGRADLIAALEAGADDFVTKPLGLDELAARVAVARRTLSLQDHVRRLEGLLPICSYCKAIRDAGEWMPVEHYVAAHSDAEFTHGICGSCYERHVEPSVKGLAAPLPPLLDLPSPPKPAGDP